MGVVSRRWVWLVGVGGIYVVWLLGVVLRRYIDFLILLIPTPLVSVLFCSSIPTFLFIFKNVFRSLYYIPLFTVHQYVYCMFYRESVWVSLYIYYTPLFNVHQYVYCMLYRGSVWVSLYIYYTPLFNVHQYVYCMLYRGSV